MSHVFDNLEKSNSRRWQYGKFRMFFSLYGIEFKILTYPFWDKRINQIINKRVHIKLISYFNPLFFLFFTDTHIHIHIYTRVSLNFLFFFFFFSRSYFNLLKELIRLKKSF